MRVEPDRIVQVWGDDQKQLTAGYSKTLSDKGLVSYMPDYSEAGGKASDAKSSPDTLSTEG